MTKGAARPARAGVVSAVAAAGFLAAAALLLARPGRLSMAFVTDAGWQWLSRGRWFVVVAGALGVLALGVRARRPGAGQRGARFLLAGVLLIAVAALLLVAEARIRAVLLGFIPDVHWRWLHRGRWLVVLAGGLAALALAVQARRQRAGQWGARVIVATLVLLAAWGALEVTLSRALHRLPLALQPFVHGPAQRLTQSSKRGLLPRDWIMVTGDSFAVGAGDWVIDASPWRNGPYQATHVLHARLNRDVLTFGRSGVGSLWALAILPAQDLAILRDRFPLEPPRLIVAYFYEGNDLEDNLREADALGVSQDALLTPAGRARLAAAVEREALASPWWRHDVYRFRGLLFATHAVVAGLTTSTDTVSRWWSGARDVGEEAAPVPNSYVFGQRRVPSSLQAGGPALGLTDEQLDAGVRVFSVGLEGLRRRFGGIPLGIVYIPSALPLYRWHGRVSTRTYAGQTVVLDPDGATSRSRAIADRVAAAARAQGVPFIDARPTLLRAAADDFIHGPRDGHLNRRGYHALADAIIEGLRSTPALRHFAEPRQGPN